MALMYVSVILVCRSGYLSPNLRHTSATVPVVCGLVESTMNVQSRSLTIKKNTYEQQALERPNAVRLVWNIFFCSKVSTE